MQPTDPEHLERGDGRAVTGVSTRLCETPAERAERIRIEMEAAPRETVRRIVERVVAAEVEAEAEAADRFRQFVAKVSPPPTSLLACAHRIV